MLPAVGVAELELLLPPPVLLVALVTKLPVAVCVRDGATVGLPLSIPDMVVTPTESIEAVCTASPDDAGVGTTVCVETSVTLADAELESESSLELPPRDRPFTWPSVFPFPTAVSVYPEPEPAIVPAGTV